MKIYRFALRKDIARQITDSAEERPFSKLFRDHKRIIIPLKNDAILGIVNSLERGNTVTKTKYRVDLDNKVAYRYIVINEEIKLDPRPMRLGKVIFKELGKESSDQWSIQQNSIQDTDYSIILSRDPIDVARMSDFYTIRSCHSPNEQYFSSAMQEAINGGAIAYLVKNQEVNEFVKNRGGYEHLEDENIFEDRDRGIRGITPISRLRINKYYDEDDATQQIALPMSRLYGADNVAGFFDTVRQYLYSEQEKYIDYEKLYLNNYKRAGGDYADERDKDIIKDFFGNDMGVKKDLEHDGGDIVDIYNEELESIMKEINDKLTYSNVLGNYENSDGYNYIYTSGTTIFKIRGTLLKNKIGWEAEKELKKKMKIASDFSIQEIRMEEKGEIVEVTIFFDLNSDNEIHNPDDFRGSANEVIRYEEHSYIADLYVLRDFLFKSGTIISGSDTDPEDKFTMAIKKYIGGNIAYENGMILINIPLDFEINSEQDIKDKIKKDVLGLYQDIVIREFEKYYEKEKKQAKFDFYEEDMSEIGKIKNEIPRCNIYFSGNAFKYSYMKDDDIENRRIIISIAETELVESGKYYYQMFFNIMWSVYEQISRFLRYKYGNAQNVGYNKEWSEYVKDKRLEDNKKLQEQKEKGGVNTKENDLPLEKQNSETELVSANRGKVMNWYKKAKEVEINDIFQGKADKEGISEKDVDQNELSMGIKVELEHTKNKDIAKKIALDHLAEMSDYYSKLKKMESQSENK